MTFTQYREKAAETAIYPDDIAILYCSLGLVDEAGELYEKVQKSQISGTIYNVELQEDIAKESGDVCWYIGLLSLELDINNLEFKDRNSLQTTRKEPSVKEGISKIRKAFVRAARINGKIKKVYRDDGGEIKDDKRSSISKYLQDILDYLQTACYHFGLYDIELVAQKNLDKLLDRAKRNKIHGSGDNR